MNANEILRTFNIFEGALWCLLSIVVIFLKKYNLRNRLILSFTLFLFGISDLLEKEAWWTPWWLLCYKAICLTVIIFIFYGLVKERKKESES